MELDQPNFAFKPVADARRRLDEPLPVNLEAVADMHVPMSRVPADVLGKLYVAILELAPLADPHHVAFQAENFALWFDLPRRELSQEDFRPVRVLVRSLSATEARLVEAEIEYERLKGVAAGHEVLALTDADGNCLEIREQREVG